MDKLAKVRAEVERLKSQLLRGACFSRVAMETRCKEEAYNEVLAILDSMQEETVCDDLGEYIDELSKQFPEVSFAKLSRIAVRVSRWQKKQDQETIEVAEDHAMLAGMEKMKEQMMAKAIDATIEEPEPLLWRVLGELEGLFVVENNLHDGDGVKVIIIKKD